MIAGRLFAGLPMADDVVFERMLPAHSLARMRHFYSSVHAAVDAYVSPARHDMNPQWRAWLGEDQESGLPAARR
jgi:hypothetical protein